MEVQIPSGVLQGNVQVPESKSHLHRLLISGFLSKGKTQINCTNRSEDVEATLRVLQALGSRIEQQQDCIIINGGPFSEDAVLNCGESGSTARFILPVCAALGVSASITGKGRLPERPMSALIEVLRSHGAVISDETVPMEVSGKLSGGRYQIRGDISSQFITGLLFALPLLPEDSVLELTTPLQSAPYVEITEKVLTEFGIRFRKEENGWFIPGKQKYQDGLTVTPEGDWSSAAFWLAYGAIGSPISVQGLCLESPQGDKRILTELKKFGADICSDEETITVRPNQLRGTVIDGTDIPDLIPILSVVAACASGETVISGIQRLRLKESDRVKGILDMLSSLGISCHAQEDTLYIQGGVLHSGAVDGQGDHRIVMSAAIAGLLSEGAVTVTDAEAVRKSYPDFFEVLNRLRRV